MSKLLKINVERKEQSYDTLASHLQDVVIAVTLDRNLVARYYVNQQTKDFVKNDIIGDNPNDWCPCRGFCFHCRSYAVLDGITNALILCLSDISRELYPDIYKELHPEDGRGGDAC